MARGNKKQKPTTQRDDYDLKTSLKKLNQKKTLPSYETSKDFKVIQEGNSGLSGSAIPSNEPTDSGGLILKLNESINSRYDKLDQNIKNVDTKMSNSNDNLRQELERKIGDKLDTKFFIWSISTLVVITILIFTLSYSDLVQNTNTNSNSIKSIEHNLENNSEKIKNLKENIDDLEDGQNEIKLDIIKNSR